MEPVSRTSTRNVGMCCFCMARELNDPSRGRQKEALMTTGNGDGVEFFPKMKRWQGMREGNDLRNASPSYEFQSLRNSQISL